LYVTSLFYPKSAGALFHPLYKYLVGTSSSDGRWAILVLDAAAAGAAGLDRSDDLVGLDIAVGDAAEDDMLAIEP
jgi:hypothetical protein